MDPEFPDPVAILIIEDDAEDLHLLRTLLKESLQYRHVLQEAGDLATGLCRLKEQPWDVVLLDLVLPDARGMETFLQVQAPSPHVPVIVLTGLGDDQTITDLLRAGAQDYLVKSRLSGDLLNRSIRYAIERNALSLKLQLERQRRCQEREIARLNAVKLPSPSNLVDNVYGEKRIREVCPEAFGDMAQRYGRLLQMALESRIYKTGMNSTKPLIELVEFLGTLQGGPRDVVDIHERALQENLATGNPAKAQALVEEGRMLLLEFMGYLSAWYRAIVIG